MIVPFNNTDNIFFFSDTHIGDDKPSLYKKRGFNSIEEHDSTLIKLWNQVVTNQDIVFLLGDVVAGCGMESGKKIEWFIEQLNYKQLYLMPGNHYEGWEYLLEKNFVYEIAQDFSLHCGTKEKPFTYLIPNYYEIAIDKLHIVMCHYPLASWNHMSDGTLHLFGHEHGSNKIKMPDGVWYQEVTPEVVGNHPINLKQIKCKT